ncbi:ribonuclease T [Wohlfahrtiimonas chitiniclastica]|uniref:ribonuclease T n=1 Tax=Wohlfahrtiimonas chitiniclastica TaxID=400946 RepID=UPI000B990CE2|nr:ribonuclease T [Wohlfahrtiimonas chitiniclastica]OYQ71347.1 ribonuclease T [Wohlfahrtiimonas chitiniclastica]OYQ82803.1 ribonuclease T [Wohlfahrtiimonas chitiniclastica]OYQ85225.1 ribonuclease T [Wohlfahrtiimonas chitiniclastica]OYQ86542.1 ribonuclease T [Wohlfahrtiimonas chitiniclastica]
MSDQLSHPPLMSLRFRGFLPVVVDVETGGLNPKKDALLEIAAVFLDIDDNGMMKTTHHVSTHIEPAPNLGINPESMKINGIKLDNPFRMAIPEKEALTRVFTAVREEVRRQGCTRAILIGHNAHFDLAFLNAAIERCYIKRSPFHPFSVLDTASLSALAFGQTVLAKSAIAAGMTWDAADAHSALYDTQQTAELFCKIVNMWQTHIGFDLHSVL